MFTDNSLTVNLSDIVLDRADIELLDKGLSFIPTCNSMPLFKFYESQNRLIRNIKLRDYFYNKDKNKDSYIKTAFTLPSSWTPPDHHISPDTLESIQDIVMSTETVLGQCKADKNNTKIYYNHKNNLTKLELDALNKLRNNKSIIIKPADKGGATVIMKRDSYIAEANRQLFNIRFYAKLDGPIYHNNIPKINLVLDRMHNDKLINSKQLEFLRAADSDRERIFYLLPKIHKPRDKWPQADMPEGRPIVSDCGSESYRVSKFIDFHIRPLSMDHFAYIKDTYDFIAKVRNQQVPSNCMLVTADVSALYTNMNIDRTINVVDQAMTNAGFEVELKTALLELLDITLNNNDFKFNDQYFLQTCGIAMGKCYAPSLADLYMQEIDLKACNDTYKELVRLYFRFLDDIFLVWSGDLAQLRQFETFLNNLIPGINITFNTSDTEVSFLDTTVYKSISDNHCTLQTKVFFKDTDSHQLLHKSSFHPKHTFKGILKSQLLRFKRISSTFENYDHTCKTLFKVLQTRGYSRSLLRKMKRDIWLTDQSLTRKGTTGLGNSIPIVIPYSLTGHTLAQNWKLLIRNNSKFANLRLITAFCNSKNLGSKLVRSSLTSAATGSSEAVLRTTSHLAQPGMHRCNRRQCKVCNYIVVDCKFQSFHNKRIFKIKHSLYCRTTNVIYLVSCRLCGMQYVGQTGRALANRVNDHLSNIRTGRPTPISLHFNLQDHSINDFQVSAIEQIPEISLKHRLIKETTWQNLLQTAYPLGINNLNPLYLI